MASAFPYACLFLLLFLVAADAAGFQLQFHHRFSDKVSQWAQANGHPGYYPPERGTAQYYSELVAHDRRLRGRQLAESELSFANGNVTGRISSLGYLYYAVVALGTPNATFLVALDTGSDLFWVPCDCKDCAPLVSSNYAGFSFSTYNPANSTTSQIIPCTSDLCDSQSSCTANSTCQYSIQYLSDDTSSSGELVQDVLWLTTEDAQTKAVQAPITFGCGQVQTGSFLTGAAPNGLLGLGLSNISVPSTLASQGLISDSFSMCFGEDGIGRINFGDNGNSDMQQTPFNINSQTLAYNISITGVTVGNSSITTAFGAIVDSGTSFTSLADPLYTQITSNFNSQVQDSRTQFLSVPFEYCYSLSSGQTAARYPNISMTTKGGSIFAVNDPIMIVSEAPLNNPVGYCLAVVNGSNVNIIGENFMSGMLIVFDRQNLVLRWENHDCYDFENSTTLPVNSNPSGAPPKASGPSGITPEATKGSPNGNQIRTSSSVSRQISITNVFLAAILLVAAIL